MNTFNMRRVECIIGCQRKDEIKLGTRVTRKKKMSFPIFPNVDADSCISRQVMKK